MNLNDLSLFVNAVEQGGFAAASRHLGISKSTVSKRVAVLEQKLAARLIQRSSRSFVLTDVGHEVYDHARAAMIEVDAAQNAVTRRRAEPSGVVKLTTSVPTAQLHLAERLPEFVCRYPKLLVQVHVTDRFVDVVQEGFDIAVRSHMSPLPDSELVQRLISSEPIRLVASPGYLAQHALPRVPADLAELDGLLTGSRVRGWNLCGADGQQIQVASRVRFVSDESTVLLEAAKAGLGIAALPMAMVARAIRAKKLTVVLPGWSAGTVNTTLLTPHRRNQLPAVRAVIDFLSHRAASSA